MAARKEVEKAVHLREFQRNVEQLLTPEDKDYLFYAMKEYNTYKSVAKLMLALNSCLDTPEKLDLLPYIRDLIPKHDKKRFDNLAPYNRMAHPPIVDRTNVDSPKSNKRNSTVESHGGNVSDTSRIITMQRSPGTTLGFSIRGGGEHELGIFVSHIDAFSLAEKSGLQVGDQIINVNGISFDRVSHSSAVLVLKSHDYLKIEVKNIGRVPGQKLGRNSFIWVDATGNPIKELEERKRPSTEETRESGTRLFGSANRHKVVLHADKKRALGFSVRGGSEYGLGIYISMVDKGSHSDEAGLQVGDQIMNVNGHSFVSIFHHEAVYILRSYPTIIMTIKSLGRLPTLAPLENNTEDEGVLNETENERDTSQRKRSSSFFKSFTLPRKMPTSESQSGIDKDGNNDKIAADSEDEEKKVRVATVRRSQSDRKAGGRDSVDYGGSRERSNSSGSRSVTLRRKPMVVSPLATHESRASSTSQFTSPTSVTQKFFERGIGTQVMLASSSSQAKQLLLDHVRRVLDEEDVITMRESLKKYENDEDITSLVKDLMPLLDTPNKIQLLTDIRSVIRPTHIVVFDELVSPYEVESLQRRDSKSSSSEEGSGVSQQYSLVLSAIEKQGRHSGLKPLESSEKQPSLQNLGAFGSSSAQSVLHKASPVTTSEPNLSGLQTRESFLAWYDQDSTDNDTSEEAGKRGSDQADQSRVHPDEKYIGSQPSPVVVDIRKDSSFLGLAIKGGADTPLHNVYVRELRKGGAIDRDGFIKPGYEVIQVDEKRVRGKTYTEAVETIAEAYSSTNPSIKFIVIPTHGAH